MDSSEMCNELAFNIGTTTTVTRSWTIKVSNCLLKIFISVPIYLYKSLKLSFSRLPNMIATLIIWHQMDALNIFGAQQQIWSRLSILVVDNT